MSRICVIIIWSISYSRLWKMLYLLMTEIWIIADRRLVKWIMQLTDTETEWESSGSNEVITFPTDEYIHRSLVTPTIRIRMGAIEREATVTHWSLELGLNLLQTDSTKWFRMKFISSACCSNSCWIELGVPATSFSSTNCRQQHPTTISSAKIRTYNIIFVIAAC